MSAVANPVVNVPATDDPWEAAASNQPTSTMEPWEAAKPEGEETNDVGNTVIVPKEGESYLDTINRAIAHHQSMTPQQRQDAINREMQPKVAGKKVAQTLGAAPLIGAGGTAALAVPGEIVHGIYAGIGALAPAITKGVQGFTEWAAEHPMASKFLWESMKAAMTTGAVATGVKIGAKVIKAVP